MFAHTGASQRGIPDISVTWLGMTSWWEVKHLTPTLRSSANQELMLLRLAAAGTARYVLYEHTRKMQRTGIVHPLHIRDGREGEWTSGFNHHFVVFVIRQYHERRHPS